MVVFKNTGLVSVVRVYSAGRRASVPAFLKECKCANVFFVRAGIDAQRIPQMKEKNSLAFIVHKYWNIGRILKSS